MRKILFAATVLCLSLSINGYAQNEKNNDNDKTKIEGSGKLVTRDVTIQSFDALTASGVFNVVLSQGNKESLKIEADDNLQDLFEVKNEGSSLTVRMKKDSHFNTKNKMTVYITFKSLKNLDLKMVGNLTAQGNLSFDNLKLDNKSVGSVEMAINAQSLDINNKSVGNLKLSGKADNAVIKHNGVGSLKASELVVQSIDIDNDGVGSAEVNAVKELKVKDSFLGKVRNVGPATAKKKVVI